MSFKATAVVLAPNDEKITYSSGVNPTRANALAELQAKLALICAKSVLSASVGEVLQGTDLSAITIGHAETVPFEDATLAMHRVGVSPEPPFVYKEVRIENMSLGYKLAGVNKVDMANDDVAAFVTAFYDGTGRAGFSQNIGESDYDK